MLMLLAMPLLASLAAQSEAVAPIASNCVGPSPAEGYLLPTRFERLIPTNTSIWVKERQGAPRSYRINDLTGAKDLGFEIERTSLGPDSLLVELRPKVALERNHRIEVWTDDTSAATFTVNLGLDSVPPQTPPLTMVPASEAINPICGTSGYEVQGGLLTEPGLLIILEQGQPVAVDLATPIYVAASPGPVQVSVVAMDLAGNRSAPVDSDLVLADAPPAGFAGPRNATNQAQLACACVSAPSSAPWALLLLLTGLIRRRR